jgi:hypothetical protein
LLGRSRPEALKRQGRRTSPMRNFKNANSREREGREMEMEMEMEMLLGASADAHCVG